MSNALSVIAQSTGTSPEEIKEVISGMIISAKAQHGAKASDGELAVVAGVCATYGLNPLVKEAHAFISGGKLQVMIGIDGWLKIMNRHPDFDGVEFDYEWDGKTLSGVTTKIFTKNRSRPVCVTEWLDECKQDKSDAWRKYPKRMLRNKSLGQCIRVAFGISEILDDDEASRITQGEKNITPQTSNVSTVDYPAIDQAMAECEDHDSLNKLCAEIRAEMEKRGTWNSEKVTLADMKSRHKARIDSAVSTDEFETVPDDNESAAKTDAEDFTAEEEVSFE